MPRFKKTHTTPTPRRRPDGHDLRNLENATSSNNAIAAGSTASYASPAHLKTRSSRGSHRNSAKLTRAERNAAARNR